LDTKIKNSENDPDKRWITTWNDYLIRIKYFFRWMYNCKDKDLDDVPFLDWVTPDFVKINSTTITNLLSDVLEQLQSMAVMAIC
jgi:integrase/recombinase XerD